jgi:polysaccharide export outer membrane protein
MHNQTLPIGCAPRSSARSSSMIRSLLLALLLLPCASVAARAQAPTTAPAPVPADAPTPVLHPRGGEETLRIGIGDLVEVRVFDTPELSSKLRVGANGAIELPAAGSIPIAGLTPVGAGAAIEKYLRDAQIMKDPRVTVFVTDYASQSVSVLGEVKNPGNYLLLGSHSLYSALSAAGGTNDKAGAAIVITHQSDPTHPETIKVNSPNYSEVQRLTEIKAGDVVFVSRNDRIYVIGDVLHPGEFPIQSGQQLSVLAAVALAEGTNPTAAVNHVSILRKTETGQTIIPVDLKRVAENRADNQYLEPDDVVIVPRDRGRAFWDATLPGLTGAAVGSAIAALILVR